MEKERQEVTEVSGAIDEFSRQKLAMEERRNALQAQVDALRAELRRKREAKQAARRTLEAQRSKNEPELRFFEDKLAMQIAGFREDALSFVFTHIDDKDYDRKFAFTIDVSERDHRVHPARRESGGTAGHAEPNQKFLRVPQVHAQGVQGSVPGIEVRVVGISVDGGDAKVEGVGQGMQGMWWEDRCGLRGAYIRLSVEPSKRNERPSLHNFISSFRHFVYIRALVIK
ncbi:hypothetical protein BC936DRAFT_148930 [Jimgerdemannia flammicorona]|uniref:Kinetochore protein SPC25 n=1 Tax=Jimgerdemannia flammicorona TaxID=994334 RepID=A0A433D204_9FUNG|nr:hypothetical protein BC936DRAFT_148930 [Jimgerdemannia flammicorona]